MEFNLKPLESTVLETTRSKTSKVESTADGFVNAWQMDQTGVCNYGLLVQNCYSNKHAKRLNGYYIHTGSMNGLPKFNHTGYPQFLLWCNPKAGWRISDLCDVYGNDYNDDLISGTEDISNKVHISIGAKKGIHSLFN